MTFFEVSPKPYPLYFDKRSALSLDEYNHDHSIALVLSDEVSDDTKGVKVFGVDAKTSCIGSDSDFGVNSGLEVTSDLGADSSLAADFDSSIRCSLSSLV